MDKKVLDIKEVIQFMEDFGVSFLNTRGELIIDYKTNTYTDISNCKDIEDVETMVVFALCRPISKGLETRMANSLLDRLNNYFKSKLTRDDMLLMYRDLCYLNKLDEFKSFINRGFPLHELTMDTEN